MILQALPKPRAKRRRKKVEAETTITRHTKLLELLRGMFEGWKIHITLERKKLNKDSEER